MTSEHELFQFIFPMTLSKEPNFTDQTIKATPDHCPSSKCICPTLSHIFLAQKHCMLWETGPVLYCGHVIADYAEMDAICLKDSTLWPSWILWSELVVHSFIHSFIHLLSFTHPFLLLDIVLGHHCSWHLTRWSLALLLSRCLSSPWNCLPLKM